MKVDQFGPVYAQANPPTDIMLFKREAGQKFSNWIVWIKQEGQKAFNNFFRPVIDCEESGSQPNDLSITFLPQKAVYEFSYQGLKVKTEYAIPLKGKEIVRYKFRRYRHRFETETFFGSVLQRSAVSAVG